MLGSDSVCDLFDRIIRDGGLDYVVATHWDSDHYQGLDNIAGHNDGQYMPGTVYDLGGATGSYADTFARIMEIPAVRDEIDLGGGCTATFVSVDGHLYGERYADPGDEANARSIGLVISWGGFDYLTLGDLGSEHEDILGPELSRDYKIDVLHVSHHGSGGATSSDFLRDFLPEFAVISCGNGNEHGHPHAHTLNRLQARTNGGYGLSYPFYNPAQQIYLLEMGVATDTVNLNPGVFTVVGDGTYEDTSVDNLQGSLHIEVLNGGCEYYFENEGFHTVDFEHGPYLADNEDVCDDPTRPPPTPTPTDCIRMAEESFDSTDSTWLPPGWTKSDTTTRSNSAHTGSRSVLFNGDEDEDYLVSPLINDPGLLVFWIKSSSETPCFRVEYSSDGMTWSEVADFQAADYDGVWTQETYDLRGRGNGYIKFSRCDYDRPYYLDDIMVLCSNNYPSVLNLFSFNVVRGWNLISYPFVTSRDWGEILSAVGGYERLRECLYEYDPSPSVRNYRPVPLSATPSPKKGYWFLTVDPAPAPQIIELNPGEIPVLTQSWEAGTDLFTGWNMIGSVYRPAGETVSLPTPIDGGILLPPVYAYDPATRNYTVASRIAPGVGYWVLFDGRESTGPACGISIGGGSKGSGTKSSASAGLTAAPEPPPPPGGPAPVTPTPTKVPTKKPAATSIQAPLLKTTALR